MIKVFHVLLSCFISAAYMFSLHYVVISLVVYCTDEAMKAEARIQSIKNHNVTVVFLAQ